MNLKIGKHFCLNITNKDWVLARRGTYEVKTRRYKSFEGYRPYLKCAIMPPDEFKKHVREGLLVRDTEREKSPEWIYSYGKIEGCEAWRFNVGEGGKEN